MMLMLPLNPVIFFGILGILGALLPFGVMGRNLPLPLEAGTPSMPTQLRHISRSKRQGGSSAMDFNTKHLPCDMDQRGALSYMTSYPRQCIWAYNNRYSSEDNYRIYKTYQLEAFFFGQFHERLKQYELEPHNYEY